MKSIVAFIAVTVFASLCFASCTWYPIRSATYVGHTYTDVASAIRSGRVRSATLDVDHDSGKATALLIDLADDQKWSLIDSVDIAPALHDIEKYNATAPTSSRIQVTRETSYGAPTPASPGPSPTSHPTLP